MIRNELDSNGHQIRVRGYGLRKAQWYSICSRHREYDQTCSTCKAGHWVNMYKHDIEHFIFTWWPSLWIWWANHPWNHSNDWLYKHFPNLRRGKE